MALESIEREGVSPLELFFDLVFVFAVSQLSAHLLATCHLADRGGDRGHARRGLQRVGVHELRGDAAAHEPVVHAQDAGRRGARGTLHERWRSVTRSETAAGRSSSRSSLIQLCRPLVTIATGRCAILREHFVIQVGWIAASAPLWIVGAAVGARRSPGLVGRRPRSSISPVRGSHTRCLVACCTRITSRSMRITWSSGGGSSSSSRWARPC